MKAILLTLALTTAFSSFAHTAQFEQDYLKSALQKANFKSCSIKITNLEKKEGIRLLATHTNKTVIAAQLTPDSRVDTTISADGNGDLEYKSEFFDSKHYFEVRQSALLAFYSNRTN